MGLLRVAINRSKEAYDVLRGRAPEGRTYAYSRLLDATRAALTPRLTFARLNEILNSGYDGYLTEALLIFEEMAAKDPRLMSNMRKRRMALTGLDYEIRSAAEDSDDVDRSLADEAADYVRTQLEALDLRCVLEHMATAIGPNLSVTEIEWVKGEPAAFISIPSSRLTMELTQSPDIRLITEQNLRGEPIANPKFVIHIPHAVCGSPLFESLSAAQATIWLIKKLSIANWHTFCEIFGMPIRIGKYDTGTPDADKAALQDMLANLGAAAWAMVHRSTDIELTESTQRGTAPFETLIRHLDKEQDILWCGGNLTSDTTGGTGTYSASQVQDQVRADLRDDDIQREARTIRTQIIRPMCAFKFPGREVPLPTFTRIKPETVDRTAEATLMKAAQSVGIAVPRKWAYDRLNIPEPKEGEDVLEPVDAFNEGLREMGGAADELSLKAMRQQGSKATTRHGEVAEDNG